MKVDIIKTTEKSIPTFARNIGKKEYFVQIQKQKRR